MIDKLEAIKERFNEVAQQIMMPEVVSDQKKYMRLSKEYKDLDRIVKQYQAYKKLLTDIDGARDLLVSERDEELRELAKAELDELLPQREPMEEMLNVIDGKMYEDKRERERER